VRFRRVFVLFGAKRLPEIGSGLGKGIKNFKASLKEIKKEYYNDGEWIAPPHQLPS